MLGKLMKHEFRATGRIGLPLCGMMIALAIAAGMTLRFWDNLHGTVENTVILLYGMSIFAVAVGIFVILMQHFKRNLLGDEGYLMRTLPVSIHELLLSKLFVALLWYIAAAVLIGLSMLFVGAFSGGISFGDLGALMRELRGLRFQADVGFWAQSLLGGLGGMAMLTLLFYADFTLSQTFSKHKVLYNVMGVVIFIVLLHLIFGLNGALDASLYRTVDRSVGIIGGADGPTTIYVTASAHWVELIELYLGNAVLYFLTWGFLKYRPNLE